MTLGLGELGRTWRTVRHLQARQLAAQLVHRARGPARRPRQRTADGLEGLAAHARGWPAPIADGELTADGVAMLSRPVHDPRAGGWEPSGRDALWTYTLHYHGWIGAIQAGAIQAGATQPSAASKHAPASAPLGSALALARHWIDAHPRGVGWEPYPCSMRALQWLHLLDRVGALGADHARDLALLRSLAAQLLHLERNLEHHLGGNHLWTNLAALASASLALDGPLADRLRARWLPAFARVADQQLRGGMHGERTPSYHCLLAHQLGGVLWLARRRPGVARSLTRALTRQLTAMLDALPSFCHPDGDVALWGDSQRGARARPETLVIGTSSDPRDSFEFELSRARVAALQGAARRHDAPLAGCYRRRWGGWTALLNSGALGLPHQVGHIHGDALSLELSLGRERVLVDAGVGTYTRGEARDYARATRAHNTVTVGPGDGDQHELWASHRIGARARLGEFTADELRLRGAVLGAFASAWHHRELRWDATRAELRVRDWLEPRASAPPATVRYHLPGELELQPRPHGWRARTTSGREFTITSDPPLRRERARVPGWLGFNRPAPRWCLLGPLPPGGLEVVFRELHGRDKPVS